MTPIDDVSQPDTLNATHAPYTNLISHSLTPPDFNQLLDLTDIYIFTKDILGCYTYVNKNIQAFLGASLTEIIGRNDSVFFDPALSHELQLCDRRVLALGEVISSEETTLNKISQEQQVFLILKSPLRNSLGNIIGLLGISTDISDRKKAERSLATQQANLSLALANINEGLVISNIDGKVISFNDAFASCARNNVHGALMFIDLDNFKLLNDPLSHDIDDILLQQVAERLQSCEGDTVARLGGDEFISLIQNLSPLASVATSQSEMIAEKILTSLRTPYKLKQHDYISTPSIGYTLFKDHNSSIESILKQADIAMYQTKSAGRNNIRFFDQSMQDNISARASLENELRMASHHNQFQLYYQPQVDNQGKLTGTEALIRWHHPTRGLLLPLDFIPIAEEMGLIALIGEWAIEVACLQLLSWANSKASQHLHIAVNISTYQFLQKNFPQRVLDILSCTGAKASLLKLEITESLLIDNVEDVITKMSILKAQGVCFSLDDFGTGYSSLYYLKKLPLDQLKIDLSFVHDILIDANDAVISQTILALAKSMDLNVIAEGVETQAQRDFLAQQGCLDFQGYLFGVAMPIEQFEALFFV